MSGDVIYPKASAPASRAALNASNERAERWRLRATAAEAKVARVEALADEWERNDLGTDRLCAADLRAALTGEDR